MLRVITWVGSCVRRSLHGWGHVWGHPSENGATHSGKGSICSKLFVRQGFCGWPGRVKLRFPQFVVSLLLPFGRSKRGSQTGAYRKSKRHINYSNFSAAGEGLVDPGINRPFNSDKKKFECSPPSPGRQALSSG